MLRYTVEFVVHFVLNGLRRCSAACKIEFVFTRRNKLFSVYKINILCTIRNCCHWVG